MPQLAADRESADRCPCQVSVHLVTSHRPIGVGRTMERETQRLYPKVWGEPLVLRRVLVRGHNQQKRPMFIYSTTSYESSSGSLSSVCEPSSCIFRRASVMSST